MATAVSAPRIFFIEGNSSHMLLDRLQADRVPSGGRIHRLGPLRESPMRNAAISAASRFVTLDCDEAARWLVGETRCRPNPPQRGGRDGFNYSTVEHCYCGLGEIEDV